MTARVSKPHPAPAVEVLARSKAAPASRKHTVPTCGQNNRPPRRGTGEYVKPPAPVSGEGVRWLWAGAARHPTKTPTVRPVAPDRTMQTVATPREYLMLPL